MITDRQLSILNAIVEDYVDFGQPIGSKTLIENHHLDISPATIRNEMKFLEDLNFIEKTHTSSGRIPSEEGFRFYVNQLLEDTSHQTFKKEQRFHQLLIENHYDISSALSYFANELSTESQYATLVIRPNHKLDVLNKVHLIQANPLLVILIMIFSSGHVENVHIATKDKLSSARLVQISSFISDYFNRQRTFNLMAELNRFSQSDSEKNFIIKVITMMRQHIHKQSNSIYMGGKVKLINALNETNVSSIQPILQYIESNRIMELLDDFANSQVDVKIGKEIDANLSDISIIASDYHFDDSLKGQIAVIGPTAMHYQNVIQLLSRIW